MSETYVSRAGIKLASALDAFQIDLRGAVCADFGCNVGGFTDCLLQRGAQKVFAVDTGYGQLAWKLRKDPRVTVLERTNALYLPPPQPVDWVVIDVAWTSQELIVPAALKWLKPPAQAATLWSAAATPPLWLASERPAAGGIISLLKPHYELSRQAGKKPIAPLSPGQAASVCLEVCTRLTAAGAFIRAVARSTLLGKGGNEEFLLLIAPTEPSPTTSR